LIPEAKGRKAVLLLLLLFAFGCTTPSPSGLPDRMAVSDGWLAMGTFFEADLRVRPDEARHAQAWLEWARVEIARLEKVYSRYDADSAVSALNRELARDEVVQTGVRLDPELESIFVSALEVWEGSGGAFEITIGPLVDVWTDAALQGKWPSVERLWQAKRRVGSQGLLLRGAGELGLTIGGMRIDLDGISKGAVLDRLRERLELDLPDAAVLLSFGQSSILAVGDPGGGGWQLVVRSRDPSGRNIAIVRLRDRALSVSSSVGSVREIADERVSHIIDPRTGNAIKGIVEAIVVADRAAIADGWSTALLVVGANRAALRMAEEAGVEVNVSESSGRSVISEGWANAVSVFAVPR
jgi:thiamine biosynthesis lipoprotein